MGKHVMIVDDEAVMLTLLDTLLTRHGFTVTKAKDAFTALELLAVSTPDLFILDVMMPGMNGFELCQHIRARPQTAHTPVIFLSARSDMESVRRGMEAGANAYLSKTTLHRELIPHMQRLLNGVNATGVM